MKALNKKGQVDNYFVVVLFLFGFALITFISVLVYKTFLDGVTAAGIDADAIAVGNTFLTALQFIDWIMILVLVVLIIGVGITSFRLNTAPIFFVVTLFMGTILGAVSYFFNYIFIQIVTHTAFTTVVTLFPKTIIICTNLHWVALACLVVGSITLFAKKEKGGFVGQE